MAELLQNLNEKITTLGGNWTKYTVVVSFVLYVLGYLVLRFHLTSIGVGTDLAVLDERYLFTGARFLVYLVSAVPIVVLLALPTALVFYVMSRLLSTSFRRKTYAWWSKPLRLALTGIVVSVLLIQLVLRQCFFFSNLLLAPQLPPDPAWLAQLLLDDRLMPLYFSGMVAGCALPVALLWALRGTQPPSQVAMCAKALLACLVAVQLLLLPVNYGVLIVDKSLPRVAALGEKLLAAGEEAWLVWEGKDGVTWLVRSRKENSERRALVTLPRGDVKRTEITGYDRILSVLFAKPQGQQP
jgi:hypothetical protein